MKAAICKKYGSADVIRIQETETPSVKDNEVLIKIHAATVTNLCIEFQNAATS